MAVAGFKPNLVAHSSLVTLTEDKEGLAKLQETSVKAGISRP
jgi:hypothetical protein